MARENTRPQPHLKHMETYRDFSGGLNTVTSNDNLANSEMVNLLNKDLGVRGSVMRRFGFKKHKIPFLSGKAQGYFEFIGSDGTVKSLFAINGQLCDETQVITIEGLESFQTERNIQAVQMNDKLIIATGTALVEYDGTTAKKIVPYQPKSLEYLYIGTNALADNPTQHIQGGEAMYLRIDGVFPDRSNGIANEATTFTVVVSKPSSMNVNYRMDYREKGASSWVNGTWGTNHQLSFTTGTTTEWELRFYARDASNTTDQVELLIPKFEIKETDDQEEVNSQTIQTCNRIKLHWDRLIIYGDTTNNQAIFISDLNRYDYFPTPNSLEFKNNRKEALNTLVRYRDMLVAFTDTTIQALFGTSPYDFRRVMLNTSVGCIAPDTAQVIENQIAFLSNDGVYLLNSVGVSESRANVEKIDTKIQNIIHSDRNAFAIVEDYQYKLMYPDRKERFRFYYQINAWTKDHSERFNFSNFYTGGIAQDKDDGTVYLFDKNTWDDDGFIYEDKIETKAYDFGQRYNPKKLKELQVLMKHQPVEVNLNISVYADTALVLGSDQSYATVNELGEVEWIVKNDPNLTLITGTTFGGWKLGESPFGEVESRIHKLRVSGSCYTTRLIVSHQEATPNQILGLGFIFKIKKP